MNLHWPRLWTPVVVVGVLAGSLVVFLVGQVRGGATEPPEAAAGSEPAATLPAVAPPTLPLPPAPLPDGGGPNRHYPAATEPTSARLVSGLVGSKHDFRRLNAEVRDLCLPCHTPHLAVAPVPRLDRRSTTTQPLRPYTRLDVELSGWSLLCLGCHDGVTATDVYTASHAVTVAEPLRRTGLGARGLRSHPVGVKYPGPRPDYHPAAAVAASGLHLPDGRIQCTTCHDAHNTRGFDGFLWISNQRSALCLTCHRL